MLLMKKVRILNLVHFSFFFLKKNITKCLLFSDVSFLVKLVLLLLIPLVICHKPIYNFYNLVNIFTKKPIRVLGTVK